MRGNKMNIKKYTEEVIEKLGNLMNWQKNQINFMVI